MKLYRRYYSILVYKSSEIFINTYKCLIWVIHLGTNAGTDAEPVDVILIGAFGNGCGTKVNLSTPFHITGAIIYTINATRAPSTAELNITYFSKLTETFEEIPVSEVSIPRSTRAR